MEKEMESISGFIKKITMDSEDRKKEIEKMQSRYTDFENQFFSLINEYKKKSMAAKS